MNRLVRLILFLLLAVMSFGAEVKYIKHSKGITKITGVPKRVVVFDHGLLDIADSMDVNVVGIVRQMIPNHLKKYNNKKYKGMGSFFEPNFESIFLVKPDLILISGRQSKAYKDLSQIAPTVYFDGYGADYFKDYKQSVRIMGEIFNKKEFAEMEIKDIEKSLKFFKDKTKDKSATVVLTNGNALSVYGEGSRLSHIYKDFGFTQIDKGITDSMHGNRVSFEYLHEKNPDYIFVLIKNVNENKSDGKKIFNNDIVKGLRAYKNNKIIYLNFGNWYLSLAGITTTKLMIKEIEDSLK